MTRSHIAIGLGALGIALGAYFLGTRSHSNMEVVKPNTETKLVQSVPSQNTGALHTGGVYQYTEAVQHIGENAHVTGAVLDVYTSKSGVTFLDFCKSYKTCPFTAVIFSSHASKFPNLKGYVGQVTISGTIKSYQGKAEIIIDDPNQIVKQ